MPPLFGDGAGSPVDQGVSTLLFIGAVLFGMVAVARWRGRAFTGIPAWLAGCSAAAAAACLVLALVLPPIIRPDAPTRRPSSAATVAFVSPAPGQVFRGNPARVPVQVRLRGGRIVSFTSTKLVPDEGHIHLYVNGNLVSMAFSTDRTLREPPGGYVLTAEFVALDHAPFDPRVTATVRFRVVR